MTDEFTCGLEHLELTKAQLLNLHVAFSSPLSFSKCCFFLNCKQCIMLPQTIVCKTNKQRMRDSGKSDSKCRKDCKVCLRLHNLAKLGRKFQQSCFSTCSIIRYFIDSYTVFLTMVSELLSVVFKQRE